MNPITQLRCCMEKKLSENNNKGGWGACSFEYLFKRLTEEKKELIEAINKKRPAYFIWNEAADLANFIMMIADNYEQQYHNDSLPKQPIKESSK